MSPFEGNIYVTGFMGTGKSTLARRLAAALRRRCVDMDDELVRSFGLSIADIFRTRGEAAFRLRERTLLRQLSQEQRLVVATGGGVPVDPVNRAAMHASGIIVLLDAEPERLLDRLTADGIAQRPLWRDLVEVKRLHAVRRAAYADHDLALDAAEPDVQAKVDAVLRRLLPDRTVSVNLGGRECPVIATIDGPGALRPLAEGRRTALLTDRHVAASHLERYRRALPERTEIVLPPGEKAKSLHGAEQVYEALRAAHLGRRDLLVALGGGVITDLGAFTAATFKRGMDCVLVSTSLVGCVDAAIGGKSAINLEHAKNQVGLFTVPRCVILDVAALATLPAPALREGLAEAYKTGLALRPDLAAFLEARLPYLLKGDLPALAEVVCACAQAKGEIVSADFSETGLRRVLNLGHTYGHAVESWHQYRIGHGQCVAAGLLVMAELSRARGLIDDDLAERCRRTLPAIVSRCFPLPDAATAWPFLLDDKKAVSGRPTFVLLTGPGSHVCVDDVTPAELDAAIAAARQVWHEPPAPNTDRPRTRRTPAPRVTRRAASEPGPQPGLISRRKRP